MAVNKTNACSQCLAALRPVVHSRTPYGAFALLPQRYSTGSPVSVQGHCRARETPYALTRPTASRKLATASATTTAGPTKEDLNATHTRIQELAASVLKPADNPVPPEQRILYVCEQLDAIAKGLIDAKSVNGLAAASKSATATSALLGSVNNHQSTPSVTQSSVLSLISQTMEDIVRHPHVFITPAVLKAYVDLQTLLHQPSSFPDVLELYASKPAPTFSNNEVKFTPASPDKVNAAVPTATAETAVSAAISAHDLPLSIDIITATFCTPAFRKAKALRQMIVPSTGLAIAPVAAYTLSQQFGEWQNMLDPQQATYMAFAGMMTYISAVSMVGYVAITTANDQMNRVTWAQGVPLWERWVREEERAAIDRVAAAWGFKDVGKRGDEEGVEWEDLREWAGRRGMVLDSVALMEGME